MDVLTGYLYEQASGVKLKQKEFRSEEKVTDKTLTLKETKRKKIL